ncbi:hypothetical protein C1929_09520 [Stenotrophomonas sp. ZAC14D1_NAIMI4_6]|nr:hypothetical protein C1929_09520 [Stenotrophomonas sp. ZAC14D1_NAIMI4_6]AWH41160.1 hypothetical protein C1927_09855 [Stenotrophomonas sp. ZAC14D1_NAIMI4_1]
MITFHAAQLGSKARIIFANLRKLARQLVVCRLCARARLLSRAQLILEAYQRPLHKLRGYIATQSSWSALNNPVHRVKEASQRLCFDTGHDLRAGRLTPARALRARDVDFFW